MDNREYIRLEMIIKNKRFVKNIAEKQSLRFLMVYIIGGASRMEGNERKIRQQCHERLHNEVRGRQGLVDKLT